MFKPLQRLFGSSEQACKPVTTMESQCDLLIIGAGPSGLMAALWASRYGIQCRIIERRPTEITKGQADGIQARSLEIFESFGFVERVLRECQVSTEMCFWSPDQSDDGSIRRQERVPECIPGSSEYGQVLLHQGRIESFFIDAIKEKSDIQVQRGVVPEELCFDRSKAEDHTAYPITAKVRHSPEEDANALREKIQAKYVIGCDGAHSWTRRQLGFQMEGEQTDFVWGVIDLIPLTNFPDIRQACSIHSANSGSILLIPRERKLVRIYVQLNNIKSADGTEMERSAITSEMILEAAKQIFRPYTLEWGYIEWWAVYQVSHTISRRCRKLRDGKIGQRVSNQFDDSNRIFLAGDAVHTHSPKAGQGMNVSMQDTYNLGWKLGSVIRGYARRDILSTYTSERRTIAQELIAFDHRFSRLFCGRPARPGTDEIGISVEEFKAEFEKSLLFASGLSVNYAASALTAKSPNTDKGKVSPTLLAKNIKLGERFPSAQVLNQADACPWQFSHFLRSDGCWRIILLAGNIASAPQSTRVKNFCTAISAPKGLLRKYTPSSQQTDFLIEILTIHSSPRQQTDLLDLPDLLHPYNKETGWAYDKVFVDDWSYHQGHGKAYEKWGADRERGAVVALRPDMYVGFVGDIEDLEGLE
ncbi:MAG: hypothetical protein L6R42_006817, partial [Xanthoria sp. 1 TBL-2021]